MTDDEFARFAADARLAVEAKLVAIDQRYDLSRAARWTYDPAEEPTRLRLYDASETQLFATEVVEVGTFAPGQSTWKWGWCNPSLSLSHQRRLLPLRDLAAITGKEQFDTDQPFLVDVTTAGLLACVAVVHLGAHGYYRARIANTAGDTLHAYLAYLEA